jgi:hypothetical protein
MILLTNGCSWTYGGSLRLDEPEQTEQRLQSVWPHHLGKLLQADEVVQLAIGCGSNQRTVRTTFEWLVSQSTDRLANTVAVIQWTEPTRYEYYEPIDYNNSLENIPERWARVKVDVCLQTDHSPDGYKFAFERSQRRFETMSHQEDMYRMVSEVTALGKMFETFGVKYYYWNHASRAFMFPQNIKDFYINNFPWIDDPINTYNYNTDTVGWIYDRISATDGHPSFQGHRDLADIIYEQIKARR